ncbi:unnamed protein product [Caenorhabditis sp. 36 PRJEB53466]|nr:unnamed protein product [Caenorhabditis sp. 36 PRJEB53466]
MECLETIHFFVDTSQKMRTNTADGQNPHKKTMAFLHHFCKRSDSQPGYSDRVRIHFGNEIVSLEQGKSLEKLRKFAKSSSLRPVFAASMAYWKRVVEEESSRIVTYFVLTTNVERAMLKMFGEKKDNVFFMDFSGAPVKKSIQKLVEVVQTKDLRKTADKIHKFLIDQYLTKVDYGISFNAECIDFPKNRRNLISLESITVVASTTVEPLETLPILSKSFLMPIDDVYKRKNGNLGNVEAYCALKQILGEEMDASDEETDSSKTTESTSASNNVSTNNASTSLSETSEGTTSTVTSSENSEVAKPEASAQEQSAITSIENMESVKTEEAVIDGAQEKVVESIKSDEPISDQSEGESSEVSKAGKVEDSLEGKSEKKAADHVTDANEQVGEESTTGEVDQKTSENADEPRDYDAAGTSKPVADEQSEGDVVTKPDDSAAEVCDPKDVELTKPEKNVVADEAEEKDEYVAEEPVEPKTTPKRSGRTSRTLKRVMIDDDESDEEYTPIKKRSAKKNSKTPTKSPRRIKQETPKKEASIPRRTTRSSARGKKAKQEEEEEEQEEAVKVEPKEEPKEKVKEELGEPSTSGTVAGTSFENDEKTDGEDRKPELEVDEVSEVPETFLVARAIERYTGKERPVILRLRNLYETEHKFLDDEIIQKIIEEAEAKKKEEEAARDAAKIIRGHPSRFAPAPANPVSFSYVPPVIPMMEMFEDSPDSPPAPESPDMAPVVPQNVKLIPIIPTTIPLDPVVPTETEFGKDVDMRQIGESSSQKDVDYRVLDTNLKTGSQAGALPQSSDSPVEIPLERSTSAMDTDYRIPPKKTRWSDGDVPSNIQPLQQAPVEPRKEDAKEEGEVEEEPAEPAETKEPVATNAEKVEEPAERSAENAASIPKASIPTENEEKVNEPKNIPQDLSDDSFDPNLSLELVDEYNCTDDDEKPDSTKYIEVVVLDMTWDAFKDRVALVGDDATFAKISERERKLVGRPQSHDYTELAGWYTPEAMVFYVNKLYRALRKLRERTDMFHKEIEHMKMMVKCGQSAEYARQFAALLRAETVSSDMTHLKDAAATEFEKLAHKYSRRQL